MTVGERKQWVLQIARKGDLETYALTHGITFPPNTLKPTLQSMIITKLGGNDAVEETAATGAPTTTAPAAPATRPTTVRTAQAPPSTTATPTAPTPAQAATIQLTEAQLQQLLDAAATRGANQALASQPAAPAPATQQAATTPAAVPDQPATTASPQAHGGTKNPLDEIITGATDTLKRILGR